MLYLPSLGLDRETFEMEMPVVADPTT